MRKGQLRTIRVIDTDKKCQFLGKGSFSEVWQSVESGEVFIFSTDLTKLALAEFPSASPHLPKLERLGTDARGREVYLTAYVPKLTSKDAVAWRQYKVLKAALDTSWSEHLAKYQGLRFRRTPRAYEACQETIERVREVLEPSLVEALEELLHTCMNYSSAVMFEFAPRNLGCIDGRLILLDAIYCMEELSQKRKLT